MEDGEEDDEEQVPHCCKTLLATPVQVSAVHARCPGGAMFWSVCYWPCVALLDGQAVRCMLLAMTHLKVILGG